jgi:hypothetical protein
VENVRITLAFRLLDNTIPVDVLFTGRAFLVYRHFRLALLADILIFDSFYPVALSFSTKHTLPPVVCRITGI